MRGNKSKYKNLLIAGRGVIYSQSKLEGRGGFNNSKIRRFKDSIRCGGQGFKDSRVQLAVGKGSW
jgi:hypothetical protein